MLKSRIIEEAIASKFRAGLAPAPAHLEQIRSNRSYYNFCFTPGNCICRCLMDVTSKILEFICGCKVPRLARTINFMDSIKIVKFPGKERWKVFQFASFFLEPHKLTLTPRILIFYLEKFIEVY